MTEVRCRARTGEVAAVASEAVAESLLDSEIGTEQLFSQVNEPGDRKPSLIDLTLIDPQHLPLRPWLKQLAEGLLASLEALGNGTLGLLLRRRRGQAAQLRVLGGRNRLDLSHATTATAPAEQRQQRECKAGGPHCDTSGRAARDSDRRKT